VAWFLCAAKIFKKLEAVLTKLTLSIMQKTVKNTSHKSLQAVALNKSQLTQVKGGHSNFIIDDDVSGIKAVAPVKPGFIIEDSWNGF
jgi:hypothetical protein